MNHNTNWNRRIALVVAVGVGPNELFHQRTFVFRRLFKPDIIVSHFLAKQQNIRKTKQTTYQTNQQPDAFYWHKNCHHAIREQCMHAVGIERIKTAVHSLFQCNDRAIYSNSNSNCRNNKQNGKLYRKLSCELPIMGWLYICDCGSLPNFVILHVTTGSMPSTLSNSY